MLDENNKCKVYDTRPDICNIETMFYTIFAPLGMTKKEAYLANTQLCNQFIEEDKLNAKMKPNFRVIKTTLSFILVGLTFVLSHLFSYSDENFQLAIAPFVFPLIGAGVGMLAQIPKLIMGYRERKRSEEALAELAKQKYPEYSVTEDPRMVRAYQRAEAMTRYGYMPEETAAFQQQLARSQTGQMRQATDIGGGGLAQAMGGVLQAQQTQAIGQFAAGGAGLRREQIRYADTLAGDLALRLQQQKNLQTANLIQRRQMLEQAYGTARGAALGTIAGGWGAMGAIAATTLTEAGKIQAGMGGGEKTEEEKEEEEEKMAGMGGTGGTDSVEVSKLKSLGYSEEQIWNLTPEQKQEALSPTKAATAEEWQTMAPAAEQRWWTPQ